MNPPELNPSPSGIGRRSLLKGAAVGTVVAWAAPQVLSMTAAAAQSAACIPDGLPWSDFDVDVDNLDTTSFDAPLASGGVVNVAFSDAGIGAGVATAGYATVAPLGAVGTSFVVLEMNASVPGEFCELVLTFSDPVEQLAFTLLDLDRGLGNWQDVVLLEATYLGNAVTLNPADYGFDNTLIQHDDVPLIPPKTGDQFTAITDQSGIGNGTANTVPDANVSINYPGTLDTLTIRYLAGPLQANPQPQQIGIGDLTFCVFP